MEMMDILTDEEMELLNMAREIYYEDGYKYVEFANVSDYLDELLENLGITDPMKAVEMCYCGGVKHLYGDSSVYTLDSSDYIKEYNIFEFRKMLARKKENIKNDYKKVLTI